MTTEVLSPKDNLKNIAKQEALFTIEYAHLFDSRSGVEPIRFSFLADNLTRIADLPIPERNSILEQASEFLSDVLLGAEQGGKYLLASSLFKVYVADKGLKVELTDFDSKNQSFFKEMGLTVERLRLGEPVGETNLKELEDFWRGARDLVLDWSATKYQPQKPPFSILVKR